ncbi:DNA cytosine methyltransferase [SAR202 cluster bacterium AD-804-J14_MRT_500m]|nr:DNA cytosine methyltransferase [SAR202 cluster bacterium AD-804-J14_MRT_500m]
MMIGSKLQTISLFLGCGGPDFGAEKAGAEVILATDIDKDSVATLHKYSKGKEIIEGDIADI